MSVDKDKDGVAKGAQKQDKPAKARDVAPDKKARPRRKGRRTGSALLVVAVLVGGGYSAMHFLPPTEDKPEKMSEAQLKAAIKKALLPLAKDAVKEAMIPLTAEYETKLAAQQATWVTEGALIARLYPINRRLQRAEHTLEEMSSTSRPDFDLATLARAKLSAAQKRLPEPGGFRFALEEMRGAALLIEQMSALNLRVASIDLRGLITELDAPHAGAARAFDAIDAVLIWMEPGVRADEETTAQVSESEESFWNRSKNFIGNFLSEMFHVQNTDEAMAAALETVVVRRALVLAQAALLDRDEAAWRAAMRHAQMAAKQLPSRALIEKVESAANIEVTFPGDDVGARVAKIISVLQSSP